MIKVMKCFSLVLILSTCKSRTESYNAAVKSEYVDKKTCLDAQAVSPYHIFLKSSKVKEVNKPLKVDLEGLGSPSFRERESAQARLQAMGEGILKSQEFLETMKTTTDAEVLRRLTTVYSRFIQPYTPPNLDEVWSAINNNLTKSMTTDKNLVTAFKNNMMPILQNFARRNQPDIMTMKFLNKQADDLRFDNVDGQKDATIKDLDNQSSSLAFTVVKSLYKEFIEAGYDAKWVDESPFPFYHVILNDKPTKYRVQIVEQSLLISIVDGQKKVEPADLDFGAKKYDAEFKNTGNLITCMIKNFNVSGMGTVVSFETDLADHNLVAKSNDLLTATYNVSGLQNTSSEFVGNYSFDDLKTKTLESIKAAIISKLE